MWKKMSGIVFFVVLSCSSQAQYVFDESDVALNIGVGLFSENMLITSLNLSAEMGLIPTADVGILSAGAVFEYKYTNINEVYYNQIMLGVRTAWHMHLEFLKSSKFDLYSGLDVGLHFYKSYTLLDGTKPSLRPYMKAFIGGRMMLNENLGLFTEMGGGALSSLKAGMVYRL